MVLNCNYKRFHRSVSFVDDQTGFLERHIGGAAVVYQGRKYLVLCAMFSVYSLFYMFQDVTSYREPVAMPNESRYIWSKSLDECISESL